MSRSVWIVGSGQNHFELEERDATALSAPETRELGKQLVVGLEQLDWAMFERNAEAAVFFKH